MGKRIYSLLSLLFLSPNAFAHGVIGARFFPATLTIDDPFVADEMSLLTVGTLKAPATDAIGGQVWVIPLTSESHSSNFLVIRSGANCVPRMLLALIRLAL